MADIVSASQKINDIEVSADAPLSEALHEKIGGSINYLIDTTDTNTTRLTALETITATGNSVASGNITVTGALQTSAITPATANVGILVSGVIQSITSATATIQIRRGAAVLTSVSLLANATIYLQSFLDTGATADSSNTYSIYVSGVALGAGSIIYSNLSIGVMDAR